MDAWDTDGINNSFLAQAQEAERYLREVKVKVLSNSSYQHVYDEHLARFYVFNYLHGKAFLASKKALLEELKSMASSKSFIPDDAFNSENYVRYRKFYIENLINRFSS